MTDELDDLIDDVLTERDETGARPNPDAREQADDSRSASPSSRAKTAADDGERHAPSPGAPSPPREEMTNRRPSRAAGSKKRKRRKSGAAEVSASPATGRAQASSGRASAPECPRFMHHRKGTYCKTCGRTP